MKRFFKKIMSAVMAAAMILSVGTAAPSLSVSAKESVGNGLILSEDSIVIAEGASATFTAVLAGDADASRLAVVAADPGVVNITPVAYAANAAAYQVTYGTGGSTVAAVYHLDNPEVVAYVTVSASPLVMQLPAKFGTNRDNYCSLVSYEFVPYDFTYADFNDYKATLNLKYQCTSYKDDEFNKWGCYGYFYDAAGNVLSKVHLYASSLAKGRVYHSEFHVPVNAVRFSVEGF
ncbi:MAG: hypothetical protein HFH79_05370 [Lachnospiraceae bacterium]|jgi:hypothetical protein|nr:hypothetical protein [Lachnospiraceae bacterium]MCI8973007.1 hypothetical protein [Lachnospiraceae bacterium]